MQLADALRLAISHQNAGRIDAASDIYKQILEVQPENPIANTLMARIRMRATDIIGAEGLLAIAIKAAPDYIQAHATLGECLTRRDQPALATHAYRRVAILQPDHKAALLELGNLLQNADRLEEAATLYRRLLRIDPNWAVAANNLAQGELKLGHPEPAFELTEGILSRDVANVRANALRLAALQQWGRVEEVDERVRLGECARAIEFDLPDAWTDFSAFNADLSRDLHEHPNLVEDWDPMRRALRGGSAIPQFDEHHTPVIDAFMAMLNARIEQYITELPERAAHPFLGRKPSGSYRLEIWGNILSGDHFQSAHIHNLGWMSGVYYVTVPESIHGEDEEQAGWLEFNRPGYGIPYSGPEGLPAICPTAGQAMFFPSYVWHRTLPFTGDGERISIAFDLIPTE